MRKKVISIFLLVGVLTSGCASLTGKRRLAVGAGIGLGIGAISGSTFSPNDESRGLNALVFGLGGALIGGLIAIASDSKVDTSESSTPLRDQERSVSTAVREFEILPKESLPQFLKDRVRSMVIEQFKERDTVTDDGVLHEPHRAWRIKRPGELVAQPFGSEVEANQ